MAGAVLPFNDDVGRSEPLVEAAFLDCNRLE